MHSAPKNILIIVAHQDDETIGCAGTIRKWTTMGSEVNVVFVTSGDTGIDHSGQHNTNNIVSTRNKEAEQAKRILGWNTTQLLSEKTQCVENTQYLFHEMIATIVQTWL